MNVIIEIIPHDQQRYPTVGDWFYEWRLKCPQCTNEELVQADTTVCPRCKTVIGPADVTKTVLIRVSKLSDWRREMLIAVHELVEVLACAHDGVRQEDVDQFDKAFEERRSRIIEDETVCEEAKTLAVIAEPGDSPEAPYVKQHCMATGVERILAAALGVNWSQYETELEALP